MEIKIISKSGEIPKYAKPGDAGFDLRSNVEGAIYLPPGDRVLITTGLSIELPEGFEVQIRPKSGLAFHEGITVLNSPGTIDCNYRGDIGVILINHGKEHFTIRKGDFIAQGVISRVEKAEWIVSDKLSETERGVGGFGSTGKN